MDYIKENKLFMGIEIKVSTVKNVISLITENLEQFEGKIIAQNSSEELSFNFEEFESGYRLSKEQPKKVSLSINAITREGAVTDFTVTIKDTGEVNLFGYLPNVDTKLTISKIWEEISINDEEYPNYVKNILHFDGLVKNIFFLIIIFSISLISSMLYIYYAHSVGVDLKDLSVIPQGNEHLVIIEEAIKSDSLEVKLNALLKKELKGVTNVTDVIAFQNTLIIIDSIAILVLFVICIIIIQLRKRFPIIFFSLNTFQIQRLTSMKKQREIILISIVIGFIINLLS